MLTGNTAHRGSNCRRGSRGSGPIQRLDASTGEIMCLVDVPAVYENVTKRVVKSPATTREVVIPAEFQVVRKQVVKTPTSTREVVVPAEFKEVRVVKELEAAKEVRKQIPAEFATITKTEQVAEGKLEWRSILCDTNMTRDRIRDIQRALQKAGYTPGPIDGVISKQTMGAVNAYQKSKGLPVDQYLNIETVRSLGVSAT